MADLKNCPFCGGPAARVGAAIRCNSYACNASMDPRWTKDVIGKPKDYLTKMGLAIRDTEDRWNRRAGQDVLADRHQIAREVFKAMRWAAGKDTITNGIPDYTDGGNSLAETEARLTADRIRAALTPAPGITEAADGRPCAMDVFVGYLFEDCDDPYNRSDAIKEWQEGDWECALSWLNATSVAAIQALSEGRE